MNRLAATLLFAIALLSIAAPAQMAPKSNRMGEAVSIVRNSSTSSVTIEYRAGDKWQQVQLEPGKDTNVAGDRIRVATTRDDKATVTVDLPVQGGKKYVLLWNAQANMWDFSAAS
jgi:hypothetical protein